MKQNNLYVIFIFFISQILLAQQIPQNSLSYLSQGGTYLAEIFPAESKLGSYSNAVCYFYKAKHLYSYDNYNPTDRFELIWNDKLIYDYAPLEAIISSNGFLITFDNYRALGSNHSVVIYNPQGELVKDFSLEELIPHDEINKFVYDFKTFENIIFESNINSVKAFPSDTNKSIVSLIDLIVLEDIHIVPSFGIQIIWRYQARYFFTNPSVNENEQSWWNPTHLYILLSYGKVIDISLKDGTNKYGSLVEFPHLEKLLKEQYVADETKINKTNIEFSSVTELLNCSK